MVANLLKAHYCSIVVATFYFMIKGRSYIRHRFEVLMGKEQHSNDPKIFL
jgi:hypothetical protein